MEDRSRIARLAAIGLGGVALVLIALWISRRAFSPVDGTASPERSQATAEPAPPAPLASGVRGEGASPSAAGGAAHSALEELEAQRAELQQRLYELASTLTKERLDSGEYEELTIEKGAPVPGGDGAHGRTVIGPHPTDPTKQLVRRVSLPPDVDPEYTLLTEELAQLTARILELQRVQRTGER